MPKQARTVISQDRSEQTQVHERRAQIGRHVAHFGNTARQHSVHLPHVPSFKAKGFELLDRGGTESVHAETLQHADYSRTNENRCSALLMIAFRTGPTDVTTGVRFRTQPRFEERTHSQHGL